MMIRTRPAAALAGAVVALALAACGPKLESGQVVARDHTNAGCYTTLVLVGKVMVPQQNCRPETWDLQLRNCDSGECNLYTRSVSQQEYEACVVGDRYPACVTGDPSKSAR